MKILFKVVRLLLTVLFLGAAVWLIQWKDITEIEVTRRDGRVVKGVLLDRTDERIRIRVPSGEKVRVPTGEARITGTHVRKGFFTLLKEVEKRTLLVYTLLMVLPVFVITYRWWLLLRVQDIPVTFKQALQVNFAGLFFNNFLPGMVGGDLVRGVLMVKDAERKGTAVGTILLDRIIGLGTMVVMAAAVVIVQFGRPELKEVSTGVLASLAVMLAFYLVYFSKRVRASALFIRMKESLPFKEALKEIDQVMKTIKVQRKLKFICIGLSLVAQATSIIVIYGFAQSLGLERVQLSYCFVFIPVITIVNALPISFGGWGVGELSYAILFESVGVDRTHAITLSLLYRIATVIISLPGGIMFFRLWSKQKAAAEREAGATLPQRQTP